MRGMETLSIIDYGLRLVLIAVMGLASYKVKAVDRWGFYSGFLIGSVILVVGGWSMFLLIAYFFTVASIATRYKYEYKRQYGVAEDKSGARSVGNVLGNGLVAASFSVLEFVFGGEVWAIAYLGAISAVTADTLATEIGLLSPRPPRLITNPLKVVEPGRSGGVTLLGYSTAFIASASIGVLGWLLRIPPGYTLESLVVAAVVGGVLGSTFDSFLGATLQAQYKCRVCGKVTEKKVHCKTSTVHVKGFRPINNHVVNLLGSIVGALTSFITILYLT